MMKVGNGRGKRLIGDCEEQENVTGDCKYRGESNWKEHEGEDCGEG